MTKKPKHHIITTITKARFMEIYQWVQAGRLPADLLQHKDSHPETVPKKELTKLKQADALMRFYQHDDTVIDRLLANKRWRVITVRRVGDAELAEMILT